MTSSRAAVSEPPEQVGSSLRSNNQQEQKTAKADQASPPIPPFDILLKWLSFYHSETGTWPVPEEYKLTATAAAANSNPRPAEDKPILTILPGKEKTAGAARGGADTGALSRPTYYSYNFRSLVYYRAALELAEKHVALPAARPLSEAAILTLGSLLAWCHNPAFLREYKEKGLGFGMYLPMGQWGKSLKMRKATLGKCLKELEDAALIEICIPAGISEVTGDTASTKRFYRLAVPVREPLPLFNPEEVGLATRAGTHKIETAEIPKFNSVQYGREPLDREPEPFNPGSPTMNHDSNKFKKLILTKNHEHDTPVETGTVEERVEFLSHKACFPGFTSPEGLTALDSREAFKFASDPGLDLFILRRIYQQVLTAWGAGKCTKNPIGFFHYTLTRHLNQKHSLPVAPTSKLKEFSLDAELRTGTAKNPGSRFQPVTALAGSFSSCSPEYFPDDSVFVSSAPCAELTDQREVGLELEAITVRPEKKSELDINTMGGTLKEQVIDALQDRFKQAGLAARLSSLEWAIASADEKLVIRLQNPGPFLQLGMPLSQSEKSLVRIALSQILKRLHFNFYDVEIIS